VKVVRIAVEIVVNIALPWLVYSLLRARLGDVGALLVSMLPPIVWSIVGFARTRRIDVLSIFILVSIALSLLAFVGGGSVRFLQVRENLVTGVIGIAFLVSAAIGKPLIYELARANMRRTSPSSAVEFEQLRDNVFFKRTMRTMTLVWGGVLLAQTLLACGLVFVMSIQAYLLVNPILGYGTMGLLALWTWWYARRARRLGAARRAAAVAAAHTAP
jgi:hypothetical protein